MKNKFFLMDLALCSAWVLAILGGRKSFYDTEALFVVLATVILRIVFTFSFYRNEKRSFVPLLGVVLGFVVMTIDNNSLGINVLSCVPINIFFNEPQEKIEVILQILINVFLFIVPIVSYLVRLIRRKLVRTDMKWGEFFGAILWTDSRAKTYSALLLITIGALYSGLAMNNSICRFVCIIAPAFSYWIVCRHYNIKSTYLWLIVIAMIIFYFAQIFSGMVRIGMLLLSLIIVIAVCKLRYQSMKQYFKLSLIIIYIGIALPMLSIGYNQYTCLDYARHGFYTAYPFRGVFYVKSNDNPEKYGLRDRYGILVEPTYDAIDLPSDIGYRLDAFCLKNLGSVNVYSIMCGKIMIESPINMSMQKEVYELIKDFYNDRNPDTEDRCEVTITDLKSDEDIVHLRVYGENKNISYKDDFFPNDTLDLASGYILYDKCKFFNDTLQTAHSVCDFPVIGEPRYTIRINLAQKEKPAEKDLRQIANQIADILL